MERRRRAAAAALLGAAVLGFGAPAARAGGFDHSLWDRLLKATVTPEGWVDYEALRGPFAVDLKRYLDALAAADLAALVNDNEKKAFWINAYNAVCIQKLIDHNLPAEVPNAFFFGTNIFKEEDVRVAGKRRSLDEIEHRTLRKQWKDNRIHAAVVCGASSCPRLRPEAYDPGRLDAQLDEECRSWIQSEQTLKGERKVALDRQSQIWRVSKIFDWYQEDFGGSDAGVLEFVLRFASEEDREFASKNKVRLRYVAYDWRLNRKP
jgi:hypothetical protein